LPTFLIIAALSYLLGSIPFGYLLVRIFHDEDVRQSGSGNIGATNVSRKSPVLGVATLVLDALKGSAAVILTYRFCMAGGVKPYLAMAIAALLVALGIFVLIVAIFRYVSLGSIVAVGSFPFLIAREALAHGDASALACISATSLLIIIKHHENIRRLLAGTESRVGAKRA
jgi:acyl phosphate:glycerol-3-phosphate acyltransferase